MNTITTPTEILLYASRLPRHYHHRNHRPSITSLSFPTSNAHLSLPPLKVSYKPPFKPQYLTRASSNPNFHQNPSHKPYFLSKLLSKTLTPSPHQLQTIQYFHDNVTCTVGPLFFASLSTSFSPSGPLKAWLAYWAELFGPLKTTLWAFLGAAMAKVYELLGDNPSGFLKTPLLWPTVAAGLAKWLDIYSGVLMVRILLSWFPNMPWEKQPFSAIRNLCDPFLSLFRTILPPLFGNLDVSPLLAFAVLGTLGSILGNGQAVRL